MPRIKAPRKYKLLFYIEQNYSFDILRPLQEHARQLGHQVCWFLAGRDVSACFLQDDENILATITDVKRYHPDLVYAPGNVIPAFIPGLKIQVFHGLNDSKRGRFVKDRGMVDLYCTQGHERTDILLPMSLEKGYFQVVETGWLKLDTLYKQTQQQTFSRPQILIASTFTPSLSCAESIFETISKLVDSQNWQWLVTLHPKMSAQTVAKYKNLEGENLIFLENDKVIAGMHRADIMVSDNSSVLTEFLMLNKPVVTFNNSNPLPCFINITAVEALQGAIEQALSPSKNLLKEIASYGPSITPYRDGKSASRVLEASINMLESGWVDKKPKNIVRNFKIRQQLNYWMW
ncbi:UDP-N-acetylglucosamine 2-epimerase [Psychromonas antarctica]|uniref:UDP-N-acetylglucosamine 2-epimerase n=1 Tax=Psychromonas antarctica TaxID=67573 RepID=UPI001EE81C3C|nr:UDP-N-acetylglucosamine 2-epimerase [Psychromonas antarctica]MCG6201412.1 UDP-N-acetylglucosamine 2-epimerase [Psychromonas antarctica]